MGSQPFVMFFRSAEPYDFVSHGKQLRDNPFPYHSRRPHNKYLDFLLPYSADMKNSGGVMTAGAHNGEICKFQINEYGRHRLDRKAVCSTSSGRPPDCELVKRFPALQTDQGSAISMTLGSTSLAKSL